MNSRIKSLFAAVAFLAAGASSAIAQPFPGDPEVRIGKLENGLTYYVRNSDNPKGKADFYIIHNVGSLQERDEQNGLAHFLEHMAFNGTKHYPDKKLLEFLGQEGVRFGADINAYTSKTETVYHMARVPLVRDSFVDSVLLVLHDWSHDITCDPEAFEQERGVIHEEWRNRSDQKAKVFRMQTDIVYSGCPIKQRQVIGTLDVIDHASPELLLDFYRRWYRPDLQALVIVGDFNPDAMVAKVKAQFSDLRNPDNEIPKQEIDIPAIPGGTLYADLPDTGAAFSSLKLFLRQPYPSREVRGDRQFYKDQYCRQIVSNIMQARFAEASKDAESPVSRAVMVTSNQSVDFWTSLFTVLPSDETDLAPALDFCISQINSMLRYGVSPKELETARFTVRKKEHLVRTTTPESVETQQLVNIYARNFLYGFPTTFPTDLQKIQQEVLADIDMKDVEHYINEIFRNSEKIVAFYYNPDSGVKIPTADEKKAIIEAAMAKKVGPGFVSYGVVDTTTTLPAGRILKKKPAKGLNGTQIWTLSNGARVWWTPVKNQKGAVKLGLQAVFGTGTAALNPSDLDLERFARNYLKTKTSLRNVTRDDITNDDRFSDVPLVIRYEGDKAKVMTNSPLSKMETAFRLVHLQLSEPSFEPEAMPLLIERTVQKERKEKTGAEIFDREFNEVYYDHNPRMNKVDTITMRRLTPDKVADVFRAEMGDMSKCDFFIVSEAPEAQIEEYVCKYLASIPGTGKVKLHKYRPLVPSYKGNVVFQKTYPVKVVSKSVVSVAWLRKLSDSPATNVAMDAMDYIMSQRLLSRIREGEGGTYHVGFSSTMQKNGLTESQINFETTPDRLDYLVAAAKEEFERFCAQGPTAEEMNAAKNTLQSKMKAYQDKKANQMLFRNATIIEQVYNGDTDEGYLEALSALKPEAVQKIAKKMAGGSTMLCSYTEK